RTCGTWPGTPIRGPPASTTGGEARPRRSLSDWGTTWPAPISRIRHCEPALEDRVAFGLPQSGGRARRWCDWRYALLIKDPVVIPAVGPPIAIGPRNARPDRSYHFLIGR